jgi:hypothetical protein
MPDLWARIVHARRPLVLFLLKLSAAPDSEEIHEELAFKITRERALNASAGL